MPRDGENNENEDARERNEERRPSRERERRRKTKEVHAGLREESKAPHTLFPSVRRLESAVAGCKGVQWSPVSQQHPSLRQPPAHTARYGRQTRISLRDERPLQIPCAGCFSTEDVRALAGEQRRDLFP